MKSVLAVGTAGFLGAVARFLLSAVVSRFWFHDFPLATFLINVSGSFALGFCASFGLERQALDPMLRLAITTGFLGAFTTFSTFEVETLRLTERGATGWALANVLASVAAGFLAARLGVALAR